MSLSNSFVKRAVVCKRQRSCIIPSKSARLARLPRDFLSYQKPPNCYHSQRNSLLSIADCFWMLCQRQEISFASINKLKEEVLLLQERNLRHDSVGVVHRRALSHSSFGDCFAGSWSPRTVGLVIFGNSPAQNLFWPLASRRRVGGAPALVEESGSSVCGSYATP